MTLTIETTEADELARDLVRLTGESVTEAVTAALRERLMRERVKRETADRLLLRISTLRDRLRADYDTKPVGRAEWDAASGDEG